MDATGFNSSILFLRSLYLPSCLKSQSWPVHHPSGPLTTYKHKSYLYTVKETYHKMWNLFFLSIFKATMITSLTLLLSWVIHKKYSDTSAKEWPCQRIFQLTKIFFAVFQTWLTNVLVDARANIKQQTWTVGPLQEFIFSACMCVSANKVFG